MNQAISDTRSRIYDFEVTSIDGKAVSMASYRGQVLLIVNVASRCVYTWQYTQLQSLQDKYHAKGFNVLGFPCNQFAQQEPKNNSEIASFCTINFRITFPLFEKIHVNGREAHPLFQHLQSEAKGLWGTKSIKWNFTKFLIDRNGTVTNRFSPSTSPRRLEKHIERLL